MSKRPLAVTIISLVYIVTGAIGATYHLVDFKVQHPFQYDIVWVELVNLVAILWWSLYAPRPQLDALACARLDRLPRDPERLPHGVRVGNPQSVLRNPGLFSLPPHSGPLLSGCQNIGDIDRNVRHRDVFFASGVGRSILATVDPVSPARRLRS